MTDGWYMTRNGQQYGPYGFEQFKQFAAEGRLAPNDMVMDAVQQRWIAANTVAGLAFPVQAIVVAATAGIDEQPGGVRNAQLANSPTQPGPTARKPLDAALGIAVLVSIIFWFFVGGPFFLTLAGIIWLVVGARVTITGSIPDTSGRLHRRPYYRAVGVVVFLLGLFNIAGHFVMFIRSLAEQPGLQ